MCHEVGRIDQPGHALYGLEREPARRIDLVGSHIGVAAVDQREEQIQQPVRLGDHLRAPAHVVAGRQLVVQGQRVGAVERVVQRPPPGVRRIQRVTGHGRRHDELRAGHRRDLRIHPGDPHSGAPAAAGSRSRSGTSPAPAGRPARARGASRQSAPEAHPGDAAAPRPVRRTARAAGQPSTRSSSARDRARRAARCRRSRAAAGRPAAARPCRSSRSPTSPHHTLPPHRDTGHRRYAHSAGTRTQLPGVR